MVDEADVFSQHLRQRVTRIRHQGIDIHEARGEYLLTAKRQELASEGGGPLRGIPDDLHRFHDELPVRRVDAEHVAVPHDDHQDVVEVMGDASGEPSDRLHLLGLDELLLQVAPLGDVLPGAEAAEQVAGVIRQERIVPGDEPLSSLPGDDMILVVRDGLRVVHQRRHDAPHPLPQPRRDARVDPVPPDELAVIIAEELVAFPVQQGDGARAVHHQHHDPCDVQVFLRRALGLGQCLLDAPLRLDRAPQLDDGLPEPADEVPVQQQYRGRRNQEHDPVGGDGTMMDKEVFDGEYRLDEDDPRDGGHQAGAFSMIPGDQGERNDEEGPEQLSPRDKVGHDGERQDEEGSADNDDHELPRRSVSRHGSRSLRPVLRYPMETR